MTAIILASGSAIRRSLLERAGLEVVADPADRDEAVLKAELRADHASVERASLLLAESKAMAVAGRYPGAIVIGADQILECAGAWFDKPRDRAAARDQLLRLAGRRHRLVTSAVAVTDGTVRWRVTESARLLMRPFSEAFLDQYLDRAGEDILASVGAYQIEGLGLQLFEDVDGDFFTILGLPLLPLLRFLREQGLLSS
jgi:septum formation protein